MSQEMIYVVVSIASAVLGWIARHYGILANDPPRAATATGQVGLDLLASVQQFMAQQQQHAASTSLLQQVVGAATVAPAAAATPLAPPK